MILFFDRSVGVTIPKVLLSLRLPIGVEYHQRHFPYDEPDDRWLPVVGQKQWVVIGHDSKYHLMPNELAALKQYKIGCFYLWGAEAPKWEKMKVLVRAYDAIVATIDAERASGVAPFIFRVNRRGRLKRVTLS